MSLDPSSFPYAPPDPCLPTTTALAIIGAFIAGIHGSGAGEDFHNGSWRNVSRSRLRQRGKKALWHAWGKKAESFWEERLKKNLGVLPVELNDVSAGSVTKRPRRLGKEVSGTHSIKKLSVDEEKSSDSL